MTQFITTLIYLFISAAVGYLLYRRIAFFAKVTGFATVLAIALVSVVAHNLLYAWLGFEEAVFFLLSLIALGPGLVLLALWLVDRGLRLFERR